MKWPSDGCWLAWGLVNQWTKKNCSAWGCANLANLQAHYYLLTWGWVKTYYYHMGVSILIGLPLFISRFRLGFSLKETIQRTWGTFTYGNPHLVFFLFSYWNIILPNILGSIIPYNQKTNLHLWNPPYISVNKSSINQLWKKGTLGPGSGLTATHVHTNLSKNLYIVTHQAPQTSLPGWVNISPSSYIHPLVWASSKT